MDSRDIDRPVRVAVVDDHPRFRDAVTSLLSLDGRIEVCLSVGSAEEAFTALASMHGDHSDRTERPDLVLIDVNMPGMNGTVAAGRLVDLFPGLRVVVCSTVPAAQLPPLPHHADVMFVPKDEIDADVLWAWARLS